MGTILKKTMLPKEKAEELVKKIDNIFVEDEDEHYVGTVERITKQCAIIAVNEIINMYIKFPKHPQSIYWNEVKAEIEKL